MNDNRPTPLGPGPDDPFERELRAILRDRAAGPVPASLQQTLTDATRGRATGSAVSTGWRRPLVSLLVAAAAVLLLAMGINPVSSLMQAVVPGPAATPSSGPAIAIGSASPAVSPSVGPGTAIFDWSSPLVTLTADDITIIAGGTAIPVPPRLSGVGDPGGQGYRTLELEWEAYARPQRLSLDLAADATHWWVSEARIYDDQAQPEWITFPGPLFRTPIGQPWSGDIRLTAEDGSVEMTNATIDAFARATLPGSLMDCENAGHPTLDADGLLTGDGDPLADGEPLADTGILLMTPADAKALLVSKGLCHLFYYRDLTPGQDGDIQRWCSAPSGTIAMVFYDAVGAVRVEVHGTQPDAPFDPTSAFGPGCAGESVSQTPAPSGTPAVRSAFDWSGDGVVLTAASIRLAAGSSGDPEVHDGAATATATRRHLGPGVVEARWTWRGRDAGEMRWRVTTDGERWQVTEVAYQDLWLGDTWFRWTDVPVEGRVGEAWVGDLRLRPGDATGGPASVLMKDAVFDPGITPADLEAPPSASPAPDRPFVVDNGGVRLSADDLALTFRDDTVRGPDGFAATRTAPSILYRDSLEASWTDQEHRMTLRLAFRRDGERWWVTDGWVSAEGFGQGLITGVDIGGPLGTAFTGDLDLTLPLVDGASKDDRLQLTIRNLSVEPFRATVARTMDDCTPVIDPAATDWRTDPTAKGQPLAKADLIGMASADAAVAVENLGYCYLFDRRLTPDPSLGVSGILETWCDAPPGDVAGLRYGKGGELHLIVVTQVPKGTRVRSQPVLGFGCRDGAPVPSDPPLVTPMPDATLAPLAPMTAKAYIWDTGEIRVAADDVTLTIGDQVFHPQPGLRGDGPDEANGRPRIILHMDEAQANARLAFTSDGTRWFLHSMDVYGGGIVNNVPISVAELGAPLGENLTGDVRIAGNALTKAGRVDVVLEFTGAEISAYRPAVARTLRDCQPLSELTTRSDSLAAPGAPLDGLGLIGAPAREAAAAMERLGYCYRFGFRPVEFTNDNDWYETWCDAPPGKVKRAIMGEHGEAFFEVITDQPHTDRAQPVVGWGCLSDIPGYESQQQEAP